MSTYKGTYKGTFFFFCEQGMRGAYAFQREEFCQGPTAGWSYDGLIILKSGDYIKVWNKDGRLFWEGVLTIEDGKIIEPDRKIYARIFIRELQGELTRDRATEYPLQAA